MVVEGVVMMITLLLARQAKSRYCCGGSTGSSKEDMLHVDYGVYGFISACLNTAVTTPHHPCRGS